MSKRKRLDLSGDLIFDSESGLMCPGCQRPRAECACAERERAAADAAVVPGDGVVRVSRETQGRKGKVVSVVRGVPLNAKQLKALAKQLKARCASGGTLVDGAIEIQGDHRDTLVAELEKRGYSVKRVGG